MYKGDGAVVIEIDFNSDEALYLQLRNQIILAIVKSELKEGENLPSVRELADTIGINMHTVNKAYSLLRQEGYLQLDRRRGAVVAVDMDQVKAWQIRWNLYSYRQSVSVLTGQMYMNLLIGFMIGTPDENRRLSRNGDLT